MPLEDFFNDLCDIYLLASNQDATGAVDRQPPSLLLAGVPCALRTIGSTTDPRDDRAELAVRHEVYFLTDPGVRRNHQLRIGTRVFEVVGVVFPSSQRAAFKIDCREVVQ